MTDGNDSHSLHILNGRLDICSDRRPQNVHIFGDDSVDIIISGDRVVNTSSANGITAVAVGL